MTVNLGILKSKTFWTALAGVLTTVAGAFGEITPEQTAAIGSVCGFLALIFMRMGVEKAAKKTGP